MFDTVAAKISFNFSLAGRVDGDVGAPWKQCNFISVRVAICGRSFTP